MLSDIHTYVTKNIEKKRRYYILSASGKHLCKGSPVNKPKLQNLTEMQNQLSLCCFPVHSTQCFGNLQLSKFPSGDIVYSNIPSFIYENSSKDKPPRCFELSFWWFRGSFQSHSLSSDGFPAPPAPPPKGLERPSAAPPHPPPRAHQGQEPLTLAKKSTCLITELIRPPGVQTCKSYF